MQSTVFAVIVEACVVIVCGFNWRDAMSKHARKGWLIAAVGWFLLMAEHATELVHKLQGL